MIFSKNLYVSCIALFFLYCATSEKKDSLEAVKDIPVSISRIYISEKNPQKNASDEILQLMQILIKGTLNKNFSELPKFVFKEKGIYLDLKGLWTYEELLHELSLKDSYFSLFFFDTKKLRDHKKDPDALSVRDLLILSEGLLLDLFFESSNSCEVKIRFQKNQNYAKDLINPYFIQYGGKWYIYRLF